MLQNNLIRQIKKDNYNTPPVNIEAWVNPFLRLSDNEVLNKLLHQKSGNMPTSNEPNPEDITDSTGAITETFPYSNQEGDVIIDGDPGNNLGEMNNPINVIPPGGDDSEFEPPVTRDPDDDTDLPLRDGELRPGERRDRRRAPDATTAILPEYTNNSPNLQAQFVSWQTNNDPNVVPDVTQILNRIPRINVGNNDDVSFMVGQPDTLVVHYQNGDYQTFTFGTGRMVSMNDRSRTPPRSDGSSNSGPEFLTQSQTPNYQSRSPP
jgi:hypothetical protein